VPAGRDPATAWETVVSVVTDYFKIEREEPVRQVDNTPTIGRIDTYPKVGATLLEPWDADSANLYERTESTLQTIRRRAVLKVVPAQGGYSIEVVVYKELEDLDKPAHATAGSATFRYDSTLTRAVNPASVRDQKRGWIPVGRDSYLEQRILGQLLYRFNTSGGPAVPWQPPPAY
jgi:hypothetical protein